MVVVAHEGAAASHTASPVRVKAADAPAEAPAKRPMAWVGADGSGVPTGHPTSPQAFGADETKHEQEDPAPRQVTTKRAGPIRVSDRPPHVYTSSTSWSSPTIYLALRIHARIRITTSHH